MTTSDLVQGRRFSLIRRLSNTPVTVLLAGGFMALMLFVMVFAQALQPYAFDHIDLLNRMAPPVPLEGSSWIHPAGTDTLGRDLFSRLLVGTQTSMLLALLGTCLGAVLGVALGFLAAHKGGSGTKGSWVWSIFRRQCPGSSSPWPSLPFWGIRW